MDDKHQQMVKIQKLLIQLQDSDPEQRLEACEELRLLPAIPDHAWLALRKAAHDPDPEIAEAAQRALNNRSSNTTVDLSDPALTASIPDNKVSRNGLKQYIPWMVSIGIFLVLRYWHDVASSLFAPAIVGYMELAFSGGVFFFLAASGVLLFINGLMDIRDKNANVTGRWAWWFEKFGKGTYLTSGSAIIWGLFRVIIGIAFFFLGVYFFFGIFTGD